MKRKTTIVNQPDKTETIASATSSTTQTFAPKMYRDHKHTDHSHGRVNRFSIGSSRGPAFF